MHSHNSTAKAKADKNAKVYIKMKPLSTPDFVKKINYIRCNCNVGKV